MNIKIDWRRSNPWDEALPKQHRDCAGITGARVANAQNRLGYLVGLAGQLTEQSLRCWLRREAAGRRRIRPSCVRPFEVLQRREFPDRLSRLSLGQPQFIQCLEVEPELGARAEEMRQTQRRVSGDRALPVQNSSHAIRRHGDSPPEFSRARRWLRIDFLFGELVHVAWLGIGRLGVLPSGQVGGHRRGLPARLRVRP